MTVKFKSYFSHYGVGWIPFFLGIHFHLTIHELFVFFFFPTANLWIYLQLVVAPSLSLALKIHPSYFLLVI